MFTLSSHIMEDNEVQIQTNHSRVHLGADRDHLKQVLDEDPSWIIVFTPTQANCTKRVNAPGLNSTGLNKAGVKAPMKQAGLTIADSWSGSW